MARVNVEVVKTFTLVLSEEESRFLVELLRNPVTDESVTEACTREDIFHALQAELL